MTDEYLEGILKRTADRVAEMRHKCAAGGPCSDNGDGCSCSDSELSGAADRAVNSGGYVASPTDLGATATDIAIVAAEVRGREQAAKHLTDVAQALWDRVEVRRGASNEVVTTAEEDDASLAYGFDLAAKSIREAMV